MISKKGTWAKFKLVFRLVILAAAIGLNFIAPEVLDFRRIFEMGFESAFLWIIWVMVAGIIIFRLIPNKFVTVGAQKQYRRSYDEAYDADEANPDMHKGAVKAALGWFGITGGLILLFFALGILSPGRVLVLTLIYSICDLVFSMFRCPFRLLFLRNKCCADCRIFNWDCMMMCAPLIVFPSIYSVSLFIPALVLIVIWEAGYIKNSRYFKREYNANLRCVKCKEKNCTSQGQEPGA